MGQSVNSPMDNMNSCPKSHKMKNTSLNNASNSLPRASAPMATGASSNMNKGKLVRQIATTMSTNWLG